ncbi:MAG: hypothetical protein IKX17_07605, partial [Prevotella sp.]|nr:hypothetical protein [Prevotella sp.]
LREKTEKLRQESLKKSQKLSLIENSDEELAILREKTEKLRQESLKKSQKLTAVRTKAARQVEKEVLERLVLL